MTDNSTIPQAAAIAFIAVNAMDDAFAGKLPHAGLELLVFGAYTVVVLAAGHRVLAHGIPQTRTARAALVACLVMYASSLAHVSTTLRLLADTISRFHVHAQVARLCIAARGGGGLQAECHIRDGEYNAANARLAAHALLAEHGQDSERVQALLLAFNISVSTAISLKHAWLRFIQGHFARFWVVMYIYTCALFVGSIYYPFTTPTGAEVLRAKGLGSTFMSLACFWPQSLLAESVKPKLPLSMPARIAHRARQALETGTVYVLLWTGIAAYAYTTMFFSGVPLFTPVQHFVDAARTFIGSALVHIAGAHATLLLALSVPHAGTLAAFREIIAHLASGGGDAKHQPCMNTCSAEADGQSAGGDEGGRGTPLV
ncbi:hypothetical protein PsYK624_033260 [Phanerochaete sordida]|uniref:Uncharacterized protein n=1 Tax=Phanerochaete sordida TaxID=48140 RepID=A0A9P3G1F1_9APHY|nr:hypothetical protein PsYK624_033260 [Phanerochaete sordida]